MTNTMVTEKMVKAAHAEYHKVLGDKNRSDPMRAALSAALEQEQEAVGELPDDLRIPLFSLKADVGYLIGRVVEDADIRPVVVESIETRLSQIETACYAALASPVATREDVVRDAYHKVAWAAKEFIDDWKKGDFSLSTLAALDAQSLDDALTALSTLLEGGR